MSKSIYGYVRVNLELRDEIQLLAHREQRTIVSVTNRLLREALERVKTGQDDTKGDNLEVDG